MNLSPLPIQKFFGNNGRPLAGGLLFTYEAGTSTKVATYTDASGSIQNTNPIVLDFRGECRLWLDPKQSYKFVLSPPGDTDPPTRPIWTVDDITVAPQAFDNAADDIGSVNNISLIIPQISSPEAFTRVVFKAANTNTGSTTLQVNGGTAHDVTLQSGQPLSGGEITGGGIYEAIFDGANWQLQSQLKFPRTEAERAAGVTPTDLTLPSGPTLYADRFGVVGAYPGQTPVDSTDAMNTLITYAASFPRGAVIVFDTSKTYRFDGTINWASKVFLHANHAQILVADQEVVIDCEAVVGAGFYALECEIDSDDDAYQSTTFFRVRGSSHKIRWDDCFIEGFKHAWLLRGCWSLEIARCRGDKNINDISAYRATGEAIGVNDITVYRCWLLSDYAVRTGDTTLPDASLSGELGETIRIIDTQFDTGKILFGPQVAGNILIQGCHGELNSTSGRVISFEGNHYSCFVLNTTIWGGYEGIYAQNGVRYLTVQGGDFRDMTIGIHADMQTGEAIIDNVRYSNVLVPVAGAVRASNSLYGECLYGRNIDGTRNTYNAGLAERVVSEWPTTGRYTIGSIIRLCHSRNHAIVEPETLSGGAIASMVGQRTLNDVSTTGDVATGSGSSVTNVADIQALRKGDYVSISGAGSGGATHYCTIASIDYANSSFDPAPNALTAVSGATITVMKCVLRKVEYANAAPSSGNYRVGDIVYANAPAAGGNIGWVCTTAGNPGTWKTFGSIAA